MSQNLNSVPSFDGTNYGYWKARMRFFLKSIDVWKIVETGWIKPEETDEITIVQTSARLSNAMIKPSMHYVKHFHHLNSQEFQIVKLLKMHGKF
jgi:hypothetical protein